MVRPRPEVRMIRVLTAVAAAAVLLGGCSADSTGVPTPHRSSTGLSAVPNASPTGLANSDSNGVGGSMPAYYDDRLFTINFKLQPVGGQGALLAHNGSINTIYMSDGCMPGGKMFVAVLDAIQGD